MLWSTLSRYFFRRYVFTFLTYCLAILLVILLVDFNESARRMSSLANYTLATGLFISALRVPTILQTAIPFVVLIASIATLLQLNRKYELVVTRAAGISAWQFLAPIIAANLLIGIIAVVGLNTLAASAMQLAEDIVVERKLGARQSTSGSAPWLRQRTELGDTVVGARATAAGGTKLSGATFFLFDEDQRIKERLEAESAVLGDGEWVLKNVKVIRSSQPMELLETATVPTTLKAEFVGESLTSPDTVPFFELRSKIATAKSFGLSATSYEMQFHRLVAQPALLAAMTLIAAMVSLKFVRFGQSLAVILGGILAGFVLYVVSELIQAFANAGTVPPVVAAWLPVLVASALGTTVLLHKEDG
ncbi:LPS export ABC transporter permease LptG [Hoeflea sp. G2-23]|uniref:LPS export ABC transporter permease LptG n=1 Tax=Hoeflea algicola TaxID=2983763 RepID=A0ABT3Z3R1_9HYPH|nr:LPS export ABC transporter permease LptG [Hoeflea algicola]MCY0146408.1 LPS export ABC transporter permease LptG [Hoeflea algicola]